MIGNTLKKWAALIAFLAICAFFGTQMMLVRSLKVTLVLLLVISVVFAKVFNITGK